MCLLAGFSVCLTSVAAGLSVPVSVAVLFVGMGLLGNGNGAVFQIVPQRFPDRIEVVTGVVGAAGGLGGFFLPSVLGLGKDLTGSYATGLYLFAVAFLVVLLEMGNRWSTRWAPAAVRQAGIFAYREAIRQLPTRRRAVR